MINIIILYNCLIVITMGREGKGREEKGREGKEELDLF